MAIVALGSEAKSIFSGRSTSRIKPQPGGVRVRLLAPKDVEFVLPPSSELEELEVAPSDSSLDPVRIMTGDVVVTARGSLRSAVAQEEHAGTIATANLIVIRLKNPLLRYVLAAYLRAPKIARKLQASSIGTATVGFGTQDLKNLEIDLPDADELHTLNELVFLTDRYAATALRAIERRRALAQELVTMSLDGSKPLR